MIHGVSANQPTFHSVEFGPGLNVVLAERSETSTEKDTRNGLGKSTLIDIIDFCLGSRAVKGKGLVIKPLIEWAFTLDITLGGNRVKVTRAIATPNRIIIDGPTGGWVERPDLDDDSGEYVFNWERWKTLLGSSLFGLSSSYDSFKYKPMYRSLISYFIRTGPNAYVDSFHHAQRQQIWDTQLHIAYLLGLNWEYASRWQSLKDEEKGIAAIETAIKTGAMASVIGTVGELEAQAIQLEEAVGTADTALSSFKVHPQYEGIQADADRVTSELHELANRNILDNRRLSNYRASIAEESPPDPSSLEKLYDEAGVVFPDAVKKTLSEARVFHATILVNRQGFLQTEIDRIEHEIAERGQRIRQLTDDRASSLGILNTHGALQEMTTLQQQAVAIRGKLDRIQSAIRDVKERNKRKRDLKTAKSELVKVSELDHEERRSVWAIPVKLFNEHSQALYERPGQLAIDIDDTGYKYQVDIERSGSEGIDKMKIFCFDLSMLLLQLERQNGIDFLIHDTLMYDSVDARQRAKALEHIAQITETRDAQYICTMNSDMVPESDFSASFDFNEHVVLTLSDSDPTGSLLGFRFERTSK